MANKAKTIQLRFQEKIGYPILVGSHLENELVRVVKKESGNGRVAIITDARLAKVVGKKVLRLLRSRRVNAELFSFPAGEQNKNQMTVTKLQHQLLQKRYGRDTLVVALGGGVVGDTAGFVAATFLRGIPYVQVPTSLLAMVDASIGGKVGIDTPYGKNTVGAFYQPRAVVMDVAFLQGLPRLQVINGLLEAVKTFFTSDARSLNVAALINLDNVLATSKEVTQTIYRSVAIKAGIVMRDEFEANERRVVNFGHTIGHALEKLSGYTMPHGFAVGFGMLAEAKIAESLGVLPIKDTKYLYSYLAQFGVTADVFRQFSAHKIIDAAKSDKKAREGKLYYVLLRKIGSVYTKNGQFAHVVKDEVVKKVLMQLGCKK